MIRNERQLRIATKKRDSARQAAGSAEDPVDRHTYREFADEVDAEIQEYLRIRSGEQRTFALDSVDALAEALIKARVAAGLTQRELAERLEVSEQMVQRDEAGAYESAKLSRLADVSDALGYGLRGVLAPREEKKPSTTGSSRRT